jgi:hypothetical protein
MDIAVDFDGTVVENDYPKVGTDIEAVPVLQELVKVGHRIILHTMRSGEELIQAVAWFEKNGIPLYGINENPGQGEWTSSPKVFAHLYIDDAALGVPLVHRIDTRHPYVDWFMVRQLLSARGILPLDS